MRTVIPDHQVAFDLDAAKATYRRTDDDIKVCSGGFPEGLTTASISVMATSGLTTTKS